MENNQTDKEWNEYRQNVFQGWSHVPHPTSKQQRQMALQQEIEQKLTSTNTTNIMNETNRMDMKLMNNIQTNNTNITWTETNRWIASVGIVGSLLGLVYGLYTIGWLLNFAIGIFLTWLLTMVVFLVKHLVDELIDWNE